MARVLVEGNGREFFWYTDVTLARGWLGPVGPDGLPMMSRMYLVRWTDCTVTGAYIIVHASSPADAVMRTTEGLTGLCRPDKGEVIVDTVVHAVFTDEERRQIQLWSDEERQAKDDG